MLPLVTKIPIEVMRKRHSSLSLDLCRDIVSYRHKGREHIVSACTSGYIVLPIL